jgi:hypothetical protein
MEMFFKSTRTKRFFVLEKLKNKPFDVLEEPKNII